MEQQLILDRYRPLEELGEGGFATVTLAWDTRMQRRVAIKRLDLPRDPRGDVLHNPPGLAEARTAAMLNNPAIVTVYDFETDADEAFVIMEHVDGASVDELLGDVGGALSLDETAAVIEAVVSALEFAHSNGVLHLDIKPGNVLVTRDGRVKVADFGMAELSTATGHTESFGGTLGYMPAEQIEGLRVSPATDVWALAVLTFECLTGTNPFDAEGADAALDRALTLEPRPASSYVRDVPRAVDTVLFAALAPRPEDRYPTVTAFADALLPLLGDADEGRASLAELVDAYVAEPPSGEEEAAPGFGQLGLWDRLAGPRGFAAVRVVAAAESAWLAWAGLASLPLQPAPIAGAVALVALAGALAPSLGTGLGLFAFAMGLFARGLWLFGGLFAASFLAWWWFVARRSAGAAVLPLSAPALGVAHVPYVAPLLAGFSLPALPAAAAGLAAGILQMLASATSAQGVPYVSVAPQLFSDPSRALLEATYVRAAFLDPAAWIALLGWPVAAFVASLICRRATRPSAALGVAAGAAVLLGGNVLARLAAHALHAPHATAAAWTGSAFAVALTGSLILMGLVILLGAPVRAEEEDLLHAADVQPD